MFPLDTVEEYEIRPYGKQAVRVWACIVNEQPKVAAELADNALFSCISLTSSDARRFAQQLISACDAAESAAAGLRKPL